MNPWFSPPWDHPGWIILDKSIFLSNLEKVPRVNAFLDCRNVLLEKTILAFHTEVKKIGVSGIFCRPPFPPFLPEFVSEGWEIVVPPPNTSTNIVETCRKGFVPVIGQVPEVVFLSNLAQTQNQPQKFILRQRQEDLMADNGPASFLNALEMIPGVPQISISGIILEYSISSSLRLKTLRQAISRFFSETSFLKLISSFPQPCLEKEGTSFSTIIGEEIFGFSQASTALLPALTVQAWGHPTFIKEKRIQLEIDIGFEGGIGHAEGKTIAVENLQGKIVSISPRKTTIELPERPATGTPWKVSIMGGTIESLFEEKEPLSPIPVSLSALSRNLPVFLKLGENFEPIT